MTANDDDFSKVRKLLAWKRREQPPSAYFHTFSDRVIHQIEREQMVEYSSWWEWLVGRFDARPVVAFAYAMAISGLLIAGLRLSQIFENETATVPALSGPWLAATPHTTLLLPPELSQNSFFEPATGSFSSSLRAAYHPESSGGLLPVRGVPLRPVSHSGKSQ